MPNPPRRGHTTTHNIRDTGLGHWGHIQSHLKLHPKHRTCHQHTQRISLTHRSTNALTTSSTPIMSSAVCHSFKPYTPLTYAHQTSRTQHQNPKMTHIHHNPPQLLRPQTPHPPNQTLFNSSTSHHPIPKVKLITRLPNPVLTLIPSWLYKP